MKKAAGLRPQHWFGSAAALAMGLAVALGGPAKAAEPALNCANPMAQQEMNICAAQEYEAADAALNAVYRRLIATLDAPGKAALVAAERAWIAYRDKQCTAENIDSEGGSMHPMVYNGCLTRVTKARIRELREQLGSE